MSFNANDHTDCLERKSYLLYHLPHMCNKWEWTDNSGSELIFTRDERQHHTTFPCNKVSEDISFTGRLTTMHYASHTRDKRACKYRVNFFVLQCKFPADIVREARTLCNTDKWSPPRWIQLYEQGLGDKLGKSFTNPPEESERDEFPSTVEQMAPEQDKFKNSASQLTWLHFPSSSRTFLNCIKQSDSIKWAKRWILCCSSLLMQSECERNRELVKIQNYSTTKVTEKRGREIIFRRTRRFCSGPSYVASKKWWSW